MNVAGLSTHSNLEKAHEVSNECKRLNKALKECQEYANIYNNRERLFSIAVTNVFVFYLFHFNYIV
jgi:dynein heavy chain